MSSGRIVNITINIKNKVYKQKTRGETKTIIKCNNKECTNSLCEDRKCRRQNMLTWCSDLKKLETNRQKVFS